MQPRKRKVHFGETVIINSTDSGKKRRRIGKQSATSPISPIPPVSQLSSPHHSPSSSPLPSTRRIISTTITTPIRVRKSILSNSEYNSSPLQYHHTSLAPRRSDKYTSNNNDIEDEDDNNSHHDTVDNALPSIETTTTTTAVTTTTSIRTSEATHTTTGFDQYLLLEDEENEEVPFPRRSSSCCVCSMMSLDIHEPLDIKKEGLYKVKKIDDRSAKFRWKVNSLAASSKGHLLSPTFYVGGFPWRFLIYPRGNNVHTSFSMYLDCVESDHHHHQYHHMSQENKRRKKQNDTSSSSNTTSQSAKKTWKRYAKFTLTVLNQKDSRKSISFEAQKKFTPDEPDWGFREFCSIRQLYDAEEGFCVNNSIVFECIIQVCHTEEQLRQYKPNTVLMFGGTGSYQTPFYNDLHAFSIDQRKWFKLHPSNQNDMNNIPRKIANHTLVPFHQFNENTEMMYIFGGHDPNIIYNNNLYTLDIKSRIFSKVNTFGQAPAQRANHTAVIYEPNSHSNGIYSAEDTILNNDAKMIIFGGSNSYDYFNDIHSYSFSSRKWERLITPQQIKPKGRSCHSCIMRGHRMVIYGGCNNNSIFDDMWEFDCFQKRWNKLYECTYHEEDKQNDFMMVLGDEDEDDIIIGDLEENQTRMVPNTATSRSRSHRKCVSSQTEAPPPLRGHTAVYISDEDKMIIFGGQTLNGKFINCIYEYKFQESKWQKLTLTGEDIPKARYLHSSCLAILPQPQSTSNSAGVSCAFTENKKVMYVFGGETHGGCCLNDIFEFDLSSDTLCLDIIENMWNHEICADVCFEVRNKHYKCHSAIVCQSEFLKCKIEETKLLNSNDKEKMPWVITLSNDILPSCEVFEIILLFLYGIPPSINADSLIDLFQTVKRLKINSLISLIISLFDKIITVDSVLEILQWGTKADYASEPSIQEKCIKFICDSNERYNTIVQLKEFEQLPKELIMSIMRTKAKELPVSKPSLQGSPSEITTIPKLPTESQIQRAAAKYLREHVSNLRDSGNMSDVSLISNDGVAFHVHKPILSSRSEYFKLLFSGDFEESRKSEIRMETLNSKTLGYVLDFLYKGEIKIVIDVTPYDPQQQAIHFQSENSTPSVSPSSVISNVSNNSVFDVEDNKNLSDIHPNNIHIKFEPQDIPVPAATSYPLDVLHNEFSNNSAVSVTSNEEDADDNDALIEVFKDIASASNMLMMKELEESCYRRLEDEVMSHNALEMLEYCDHVMHDGFLRAKCFEKLKEMSKNDLVKLIDQLRRNTHDPSKPTPQPPSGPSRSLGITTGRVDTNATTSTSTSTSSSSSSSNSNPSNATTSL